MAEQYFVSLANEAYWSENGQWLTVILYSELYILVRTYIRTYI